MNMINSHRRYLKNKGKRLFIHDTTLVAEDFSHANLTNERKLRSFPGFHFASKSWCETYCKSLRYLCKIQIPKNVKINEPWATDGKVSADSIIILSVYDTMDKKMLLKNLKIGQMVKETDV